LHTIETETTNDIAANPKQISTLSLLKETDEDMGDDAFVHGYMRLAEAMAKDIHIIT